MSSLSPWLSLREGADRAARSVALTRALVDALPREGPLRVLDLGSGTGSNLRYLSPRLPSPQYWRLVDLDGDLLDEAARRVVPLNGIQVETACMNLGQLDRPQIFDGCHLVTASALLDLVSERWLRQLAAHCRAAGSAILFALTYDGRSSCWPAEPEDAAMCELLNRHQTAADKGFGVAAGPAAASAVQRCFREAGYHIRAEASDWRLPADARELQRQLFEGWAHAAVEIDPARSTMVDAWLARRLKHIAEGRSTVVVGHQDVMGRLEFEPGATAPRLR